MRIVSLLPSATEILFALGLDREIVGVSHECDFPPRARTKKVVLHSRIPHGASPSEIDRLVREYSERGENLYQVDAETLEALAPDLIITQDLCHVCAASPDDLSTALSHFDRHPQVLCLNPRDLTDVWRDILWIAEETGRGLQAEAILEQIGERLGNLERQLGNLSDRPRPRVAFLEWLQPIYVGGHWVPEMIQQAGGQDVLGETGTPSFRVPLQDVVEAEPEILLIAPCGYTASQARDEYRSIDFPEQWSAIPAVRNGRVYALEAAGCFSRPGPRLIDGIEVLSKIFHPAVEVPRETEAAFLPIAGPIPASRATSA